MSRKYRPKNSYIGDIKLYPIMIRTAEALLEAETLYGNSKFREMLELLTLAILGDSRSPELYFLRGIAFTQLQRYDEAIDDLTRAVDLRPDYFRAWQNRGLAWSLKRKYDKAISDFNRAIELRPQQPSTYRHLGNALLQANDYDHSIEIFNKAIELEPESYDLYHNRASAWRKKGAYRQAIDDYNRVFALRPDHARTLFGLGLIYEAIKEPELASVHYKRAYHFGFDKTEFVRIFTEQYPSPYIAKAILADNNEMKRVVLDLSTIQWLGVICKTWDQFLESMRTKGFSSTHPGKYYSLVAIVHFYMGDPMTSYRIFDTQFDSADHPDLLSLRDQYYLALAALDFKEPDSGLAYAVREARLRKERREADGDRSSIPMEEGPGGPQRMDRYYEGQLFLLHDDLSEAWECFDECGMFAPALYGKIAVQRMQGDEEGVLQTAKEIEALTEEIFLDGIMPLVIQGDTSFGKTIDKIFSILPFYEQRGAIEVTRALLGRTPVRKYLEFHELLKL
jgi:tetratricopeptide (TPR) repeat protein